MLNTKSFGVSTVYGNPAVLDKHPLFLATKHQQKQRADKSPDQDSSMAQAIWGTFHFCQPPWRNIGGSGTLFTISILQTLFGSGQQQENSLVYTEGVSANFVLCVRNSKTVSNFLGGFRPCTVPLRRNNEDVGLIEESCIFICKPVTCFHTYFMNRFVILSSMILGLL